MADAVRGLRVLVVDDNADVVDVTVALIRMLGHRAEGAYNAGTALAIARVLEPDIALVDLAMPETSGLDLAPRLLAEWPHIWLVAVTGWAGERHRAQAMSAGFARYALKPIVLDELKDILDEARESAERHRRPGSGHVPWKWQ